MALFDAFLKLDGIKGESADAKHKGEIDIESFSWGLSQTGTSAQGGGGGAGKVKVHDFTIIKRTDASSPLLMLNCANGAHIKEANFVVRKAGGEQLEYLKIKLTDVLVSSYKPHGITDGTYTGNTLSGDGGKTASDDWEARTAVESSVAGTGGSGDGIPTESVTLNFAKVEFTYQPQGADGKAQGGPILAGWDVKANQKV
jgi:type VI secretion system secreted protein Hcp